MLTVDEARALVTTSLSDADLADVISRQEAWLARRVGPLDGQRTETFVTPDGDEVLHLQRPGQSDSMTVSDEGGAVTAVALRGWSDVVRTDSISWDTPVTVAYTPSDEDEVKEALLTLVRLAVTESGFNSESQQGYSYSHDHGMRRRMRWEAWRQLLRPRTPESTRLRSAIPTGGESVAGVQVMTEAS